MKKTNAELQRCLSDIIRRYERLEDHSGKSERFLLHLRSLGHWEEDTNDYPDATPVFPETVHVAYAVCHPSCGVQELIIDGSTQECQRCGSNMFRISSREYHLKR